MIVSKGLSYAQRGKISHQFQDLTSRSDELEDGGFGAAVFWIGWVRVDGGYAGSSYYLPSWDLVLAHKVYG